MKYRIEKDSLGDVEVNDSVYWGAQTQRSLKFFNIGNDKMPLDVIEGLLHVKKAAAKVNLDLNKIDKKICDAITDAAEHFLTNLSHDHFPLSVWQTGSGTQSNMNVNEVLANKANQLMGEPMGNKHPVHPNDHVNCSQSSNDTFPTAMHVAVVSKTYKALLPALTEMSSVMTQKAQSFDKVIKIGRTHLQDATPLSVQQEFSAFIAQLQDCKSRIENGLDELLYIAQGGTAVGTGLNAHPRFAQLFADQLAAQLGYPFKTAPNKFAALAAHDPLVQFSGTLNTLAVALNKIANDIRWLASGPRCGIGELNLPANEPGSSIMPGKVNPTQAEALSMVCCQVMGNHTAVTFAGSQGHFQLNTYKPVIVYNVLHSLALLTDAMRSFTKHCLKGLKLNTQNIETNKNNSLMLVTALAPHIGYDKAAQIANYAHKHGLTLKEAAMELKVLSSEDFETYVRPETMIAPGE